MASSHCEDTVQVVFAVTQLTCQPFSAVVVSVTAVDTSLTFRRAQLFDRRETVTIFCRILRRHS